MQLRLHFTIYVGHNTSLHCPGVIKLHMGDNVIHYYKRFEIQSSWTDQPWQCYTHMQTHTCTLTWIFKSWSIGEPRLMNMLTSTPCRILRSIHPHTHTHTTVTWSLYSPEDDSELTETQRERAVTSLPWCTEPQCQYTSPYTHIWVKASKDSVLRMTITNTCRHSVSPPQNSAQVPWH